jgi:hypothetical protein
MTRQEWIDYHVERAPEITEKQWVETLLLLETRKPADDTGNEESERAG